MTKPYEPFIGFRRSLTSVRMVFKCWKQVQFSNVPVLSGIWIMDNFVWFYDTFYTHVRKLENCFVFKWSDQKHFFCCWPSLGGHLFWPPLVYISVIIAHILQITIFHMLDLCRQLSCTASTPVLLTCGFGIHEALIPF